MAYLKTIEEAKFLLAECEEFTTGTLSAQYEYKETAGRTFYVVRSYGVVIAWQGDYETQLADNAYTHSKTTSKHANIVAKAWGLK